MIETFRIDPSAARTEFGTLTQRLVPWSGQAEEPPFGQMALFLAPGAQTDPDYHNQDELVTVLAGEAEVELAGETVRIGAFETAVLPRNTKHVIRNPGDRELVWLSTYWPLHEPQHQPTGREHDGE